jgi:hypothetical protein
MSELHIYAQSQWHGSSYIVGDRLALLELRQAITNALDEANNCQSKTEFFCSDGEGYQLYIKAVSSDVMNDIQLPYTDVEPSPSRIYPSGLT